jgi:hypothetical protein
MVLCCKLSMNYAIALPRIFGSAMLKILNTVFSRVPLHFYVVWCKNMFRNCFYMTSKGDAPCTYMIITSLLSITNKLGSTCQVEDLTAPT